MESLIYDRLDVAEQPECPLCGSIHVLGKMRIYAGSIPEMYGKAQKELVRHELKGTSWINVCQCQNCFLIFFEPKISGSPEFYKSLQSFEWYYQKDKAEFEMAGKWIPPNARILEVGCGAGWFASRLAAPRYTGLEYSESAADKARSHGLDVRTQSMQEHALANPSAYQIIYAFQVLEHISNPGSFIAACLDCLEPGGLLIYGVPNNDSYMRFIQNDRLNLPPHHITRWPDRTLESIPRIFPVSLVSIEHEVLSDIHLRTCVGTMIKRRLDLLFGREETIVDRSLGGRLLNRCAHVLAGCIATLLNDAVFRPRGHTVIAIYRKKIPVKVEPNVANGFFL
jgi:SAM-dependent methyltransferase